MYGDSFLVIFIYIFSYMITEIVVLYL